MADKYIHELPKEESFDAWVKSIPECCKNCENASWHSLVTTENQIAVMVCPILYKCEKRKENMQINGR